MADILLWGLLAAAGVAIGFLVYALTDLKRRVDAIHAQLVADPALPPESAGRPLITIEILNPFELAVRDSKLAGPVSKLVPRVIERIVYQRAAGIIKLQLEEQGVIAQVKACHAG